LAQHLTKNSKEIPAIALIALPKPTRTQAWNEQRIRESFRRDSGRDPTEQEMLGKAALFVDGSGYAQHIGPLRSGWDELVGPRTSAWNAQYRTAETTRKTTGCNGATGPAEYEFVEDLKGDLDAIVRHERAIVAPIRELERWAPEQLRRDKEFILKAIPTWQAHFPEVDATTIRGSVAKHEARAIDEPRRMYRELFPGGNPTTEYRYAIPLLAGLLGALGGAAAGAGADYLGDQMYRRRKSFRDTLRELWNERRR
jgi:hypothetical protein